VLIIGSNIPCNDVYSYNRHEESVVEQVEQAFPCDRAGFYAILHNSRLESTRR
jgi:hypothetical protein